MGIEIYVYNEQTNIWVTLWQSKNKLFFSFFFSGLGFANFMASCFVGLYYNMIIAWTIYYFFASFTSHLPWDSCNNDFNTECKFQNHFFYLFIYIVVNYFLKKKTIALLKNLMILTESLEIGYSPIHTKTIKKHWNQVFENWVII